MNADSLLSQIVSMINAQDERTLTAFFALLSIIVSIAAFWRSSQGFKNQRRNMWVEQSRYLDGHWQSLIQLILSKDEFASWIGENFSEVYGEDVKLSALRYWLANVLSSAYRSLKFDLIERSKFEAHLFSVWLFWNRDSASLLAFLREGYQSADFISECEKCLKRIEERNIKPSAEVTEVHTSEQSKLDEQEPL